MAKILPHTERFLLVFNKLKGERKLPSNATLAEELGLGSGNTLTEIRGGRQNISLKALQKFCDLYGKTHGYDFAYFAGETVGFDPDDPLNWERAKVIALERRLAQYMSMLSEVQGKKKTYQECLDDIDSDTEMILAEMRRAGKRR